MLLRGQMTEFHMHGYLPFPPIALYSTAFGFLIVHLSHKAHPSQMRFARLIVRLEERKVVGRKTRKSFSALFAVISQVWTCHQCAFGMHGHLLSNGANWQRKGKYKSGKKWSGWNQTNQTGSYSPDITIALVLYEKMVVIHMQCTFTLTFGESISQSRR